MDSTTQARARQAAIDADPAMAALTDEDLRAAYRHQSVLLGIAGAGCALLALGAVATARWAADQEATAIYLGLIISIAGLLVTGVICAALSLKTLAASRNAHYDWVSHLQRLHAAHQASPAEQTSAENWQAITGECNHGTTSSKGTQQ